jgi:Helix-turn-helix.
MKISKFKLNCAMFNAGIRTGKELAAVAKVSVNTVSAIMRGANMSFETVVKIAAAVGVDPLGLLEAEK